MKNVRRTISFSPRVDQMLKEIMEEKGYISMNSVVIQSVIDMHSKAFPAYVAGKSKTPKEKVRDKMQEQALKDEIIEEQQLNICKSLDGRVYKSEGGAKMVEYFTYDGKNRHQQDTPISMVSEETLNSQYQPSKKKVEEIQEAGKANY